MTNLMIMIAMWIPFQIPKVIWERKAVGELTAWGTDLNEIITMIHP